MSAPPLSYDFIEQSKIIHFFFFLALKLAKNSLIPKVIQWTTQESYDIHSFSPYTKPSVRWSETSGCVLTMFH